MSYFDYLQEKHFVARASGQNKKEHVTQCGYVNKVKNITEDEADFQSSMEVERFIERQLSPTMGQTSREKSLERKVLMYTARDSSS